MFIAAEALGLVMAVLEGHPKAADPADPVGGAHGGRNGNVLLRSLALLEPDGDRTRLGVVGRSWQSQVQRSFPS